VEKEDDWAQHQSGHNSGVVHSGLYYRPGSLKARLAIEGAAQLEEFCAEHEVPFRRCGKLVVATRPREIERLHALAERGRANGVKAQIVGRREIAEREPHVQALAGLWVESTGICDFAGVARVLARLLESAGADLRLRTRALELVDRGDRVQALLHDGRTFVVSGSAAVGCAGLHADRLLGDARELRIVPVRGEYALLRDERAYLVNGLIYPLPDPQLPFLGVHFTRCLDGRVLVGPNAVPAAAREGYRRRDVNAADLREAVGFGGAWRLARRQTRYGVGELSRSLIKPLFVAAVRRMIPDVTAADLVPGPAGVRAQAVRRDGSMLDDFEVRRSGSVVHVLNAPSPAATSCLALGEHIAALIPR
jgi:L-2-hydroxyglutarate oxidase